MIYDAKAKEIDGILKIAAAAGSEWKGASSSLSPSTAQSRWRECALFAPAVGGSQKPGYQRGYHGRYQAVIKEVILAVIKGVISAVNRALHNPAPSPSSRKNQSKNWVLVEK
jgi:hypothetical protein